MQGRIQDFIGEPDLKDCQTALTPLMNTFIAFLSYVQFEKKYKIYVGGWGF